MRRADRLYALVEELRARAPRPVVRSILAERLEVTARTVERDVLALQQAGVPIWSQRGRGGGYALDRRWSLPPLNFDATEALAVIAALATARSMPFAEAGRRAEQKLLAAMTAGEAARARELAGRIRLGSFGEPVARHIAAAVEKAVVERRVVEIGYRDRHGNVTVRPIEAQGLHLSSGGSYLIGWCRLRDAGRAFRVDRIASVSLTGQRAPDRALDPLLDWVDDAVAPDAATGTIERGSMPITAQKPRRVTRWGPPRRADDRTGATAAFAAAVASSLPGVESTTRRRCTSFAVDGQVFLALDDEERATVTTPNTRKEPLPLQRAGRDEVRGRLVEAWEAFAPKRTVTAYQRSQDARQKERPVTHEDVREVILALPGATEGPIWGSTVGFLIGADKKTRFARFGPGIGNLLPPDEDDALAILRCPQRPALLASRPDRYFITPHYGEPDEPGAVITRLSEHRGPAELDELAELLEDAWREVAGPVLVAQLEARP